MAVSILLPLVGYIELTKGQRAIVDWEDVEWLLHHKWYFKEAANGNGGYAARIDLTGGKRTLVMMHRAIFLKHNPDLSISSLEDVDHINGLKLDNRSSNLRAASRHQNSGNRGANKRNTSGYKGVNFYAKSNSWRAQIMDNGKKRHIGYYASPEEAALAYNIRSREIFGEFAYQNPISNGLMEAKKLSSSRSCQPFKGVYFNKHKNKFVAYIKIDKRRKHLGYFTTESEATNAVQAAKEIYNSRVHALTIEPLSSNAYRKGREFGGSP